MKVLSRIYFVMSTTDKILTEITVTVFNTGLSRRQRSHWIDKDKLYYDLVPLTQQELDSIVKCIRILSRHNHRD